MSSCGTKVSDTVNVSEKDRQYDLYSVRVGSQLWALLPYMIDLSHTSYNSTLPKYFNKVKVPFFSQRCRNKINCVLQHQMLSI